jgi:hypothetical protein
MGIGPNRMDGTTSGIDSFKEALASGDMHLSPSTSGHRRRLLRLMEVGQGRSLRAGHELGNAAMLDHNDLILINIFVRATRGSKLERALPYKEQVIDLGRVQRQPTVRG